MKNLRRFQSLILIFLSLFLLTSCSNGGTVTPELPIQESILLNVEYQAGGNFNGIIYGCVPATTYMNFNYLGASVTLESVLNAGVVQYKSLTVAMDGDNVINTFTITAPSDPGFTTDWIGGQIIGGGDSFFEIERDILCSPESGT